MNETSPLGSSGLTQPSAAEQPTAMASAIETGREKLHEAQQFIQQQAQGIGHKASEVMHSARDKMEHAGSGLLQWTRENPATALMTFFASGLVLGCLASMDRHKKSFGERFSDHPIDTLRDAVASALLPAQERMHDVADSTRSLASSVGSRLRHMWN